MRLCLQDAQDCMAVCSCAAGGKDGLKKWREYQTNRKLPLSATPPIVGSHKGEQVTEQQPPRWTMQQDIWAYSKGCMHVSTMYNPSCPKSPVCQSAAACCKLAELGSCVLLCAAVCFGAQATVITGAQPMTQWPAARSHWCATPGLSLKRWSRGRACLGCSSRSQKARWVVGWVGFGC